MTHQTRPKDKLPVVYTSRAKCRDCYRCVRVCPVQAIRMKDGQAEVITELCIACGTCITACPQQAKAYRTDYNKVLQMMEENHQIAISIAPSFVIYYDEWQQKRLPSALRMAGFSHISETAIGAYQSAKATAEYVSENPHRANVCTACPATVNYVMHEKPELAGFLVEVVSPMIAHAKMLKKTAPKRKVVFAGPCVAKKDEAQWTVNQELVDAVLTFDELDELLSIRQINLDQCEESSFDDLVPGDASLFPLEGGLLRTAGLKTDMLDEHVIAVSGFREVKDALEALNETTGNLIIEPMFCKNGCINGPFAGHKHTGIQNRAAILNYAAKQRKPDPENIGSLKSTSTHFDTVQSGKKVEFSEDQIREVLKKTGKLTPSDELNCTACGYPDCRTKAIAVLKGLAEPEMCMPYMRRIAEQKFDTMIDYDPNGIVLLDHELRIIHMNPAFKKMFSCSDALLAKKISYLIDPDPFEQLVTKKVDVYRSKTNYSNYNLLCHLVAYVLPENQHYVGIFMDITDTSSSKEKLRELQSETVIKAQELIEHQISMAQELARFLGEHTAAGEILMKKLIDSIKK